MGLPVFALDIGTRTVIGIVGNKQQEGFYLQAVEVLEHESRSMLDGQIHNVNLVAEVVMKVKEKLEVKTGLKLRNVAVAAAGRALKTIKYLHKKEIDGSKEIEKEDVLCLEIEAVALAQQLLAKDGQLGEGINSYHCVGYSVINFYLEDNLIGNLEGQYGKNIGVHIITTFLPRIVVDSLYTVLKKADLEMTSLTLEPIAASNVIIPPSMRKLNIALVDIGAGTSDIAIAKDGTIASYAMVPVAGDEITEALCDQYLLDFNEGERAKRLLATQEKLELTNVLGETSIVTSKEIIKNLVNIVDNLANMIAEQILAINEKLPQAVFCVGGGSQFPTLAETIAIKLGLPAQRAVVKGKEIVFALEGDKAALIGPEAITPLGIAFSAEEQVGLTKAEVNGRIVSFLNTKKPTVADALLAANINLTKLYGRPGLSITAEVNGEMKIIKGSLGTRPGIKLNGRKVKINHQIEKFCKITVEPGVPGKNAQARINDVVRAPTLKIIYNDSLIELVPPIYVNNRICAGNDYLADGAKIICNKLEIVRNVLTLLEYDLQQFQQKSINFYLNDQPFTYSFAEHIILLNNRQVDLSEPVNKNDSLKIVKKKEKYKRIREILTKEEKLMIKVTVNNKQISINSDCQQVIKNGIISNMDEFVLEGDKINYEKLPTELIIADLLNYINFNTMPDKKNARLLMLINQNPAQFTSKINDGDNILLDWK